MERRDSRRTVRVFGVGLIVVLAAGAVAAPGPDGGRGGYGPGGGGGYATRTPTPTPTATATPTPTPTPDTTAPSVNSRIGRGQTARSILKRGLVLTVQCTENCTHQTRLFVNKKQARKLGIKKNATRRVLIGKKTVLLQGNVGKKIRVKLNSKGKRGIRRMKRRHVKKLQLQIATAAKDAANNVRRSTQTQTFKR